MELAAHGNETLLRNSDSHVFTNFPGLELRHLELDSTRCTWHFHHLLGAQVFYTLFSLVCFSCVCVYVYFIGYEWTWLPKASPAHLFIKTGSEEPRKQMCDACLVLPAAMFPPSGGRHPGWERWSKFRQAQAPLSPIWSSPQIFNGVINLQKAKLKCKHLFSLKKKKKIRNVWMKSRKWLFK